MSKPSYCAGRQVKPCLDRGLVKAAKRLGIEAGTGIRLR
jgi:hypothetical protein